MLQNVLGNLALDTSSQQLLTELTKKPNAGVTIQVADTTDLEYAPTCALLTAAGDTIVYTPAAGKSIRLHRVYMIGSPATINPPVITLSLGAVVKYIVYGVSTRQQDTGPVNGALKVNLSLAGGSVACSFRLEEV